ncbi:alpha/beta fold hydrolase [Nocardiopsis sp. LOL_012]|uniref:alpha/beta fold hydrolase n=1 Tax=Nocardiopsis sp. LOL_012 TaxID=3345409 RepID=UPI003A8524DB
MSHATAADGTRIRYDSLGKGEPLLLVHGQSLDRTMWDGVAEELADRYRVVRVDLRGTGESDAPVEAPYSTGLLAGDVLAVLDHAGLGRAHVYGFSMGGRVAQVLAATAPERVGALVLGATAPGGAREAERPAEAARALRQGAGSGFTGLLYTPGWAAEHPEAVAVMVPRNPPRARRRHYEASLAHDAWDLLPRIQAPTLVLHGGDDPLTPVVNARLLADRIPGARLRVFPGARHGYLHEARAEATGAVLAFLAGHRV